MAKIVLGLATSHAPQLRMPPSEWGRRAKFDRQNPELWYAGKVYSFPELHALRAAEHFERQLAPEIWQARFETCQRAIEVLATTLRTVAPDVCVLFGDDQHETFFEDNMPAISVYWGATVDDAPQPRDEPVPDTAAIDTPYTNAPPHRVSHPTHAALGRYLIEALIEQGFDVAHTNHLPETRHRGTIGHAFNFVYRRLMNNQVLPNVPIFLNTYFPPNQPTLPRCYQLGQAVRRALDAWDGATRVAVIASGGLSHFVIEEDLDQYILAALRAKDAAKLTALPSVRFNSGTSEIRNWIALAGVVADDGLEMRLVDYVPCYRTEAGTGCAMGFAIWQ
jgi:3-O-methylgallate 3,4-dioxygenase